MRWAVILATLAIVGACQASSPGTAVPVTPGATSPVATHSPADSAPPSDATLTPVPVGAVTPAPSTSMAAALVAMDWTVDVAQPAAATVVMDDGRVAWNENGTLRQLRLGPGGLDWVRDQLDATGLLDRSGTWEPRLRVGANPPGHGVTSYAFTLPGADGPVRVTTSDPGGFDHESWIVPPEMEVLGGLAAAMVDADGWIPAELVADGPAAFQAAEYLAIATFYLRTDPDRSALAIDVDDVAWPPSGRPDAMGDPMPGAEPGQIRRCAVVTADTAGSIASALTAAGASPAIDAASSSTRLRWAAGEGLVELTLQQLLPDRHGCDSFVE